MHQILTALILVVGLASCSLNKHKSDSHTLNFDAFTIETPKGWTKVEAQGIDSYVGKIAIDKHDTLHFDLGYYSNNLEELSDIVKVGHKYYYNFSNDTIPQLRSATDSMSIEKLKKNDVFWDSIDGYRVKVVLPKYSGIGTTGIYIDSLQKEGAAISRFNLYGHNLKPENEKAVLQAIKTLKFDKMRYKAHNK